MASTSSASKTPSGSKKFSPPVLLKNTEVRAVVSFEPSCLILVAAFCRDSVPQASRLLFPDGKGEGGYDPVGQ